MLSRFAKGRFHFTSLHHSYLCLCISASFLAAHAGIAQQPPAAASPVPDFDKDVAPIFQKNCAGCHSSSVHKGGLVLDSYEAVIKGGRHGQVIVAHDPDASRLMEMIEGKIDPQMPLDSNPLGQRDLSMIRAWISAGVPAPAPGSITSTTTREVLPAITPQVPAVSPVASVKFSPDGSVLAVGGYQAVRLFAMPSDKPIAELAGHADAVRSIAFSPDGKMLAAAGGEPQREGEIKIWDLGSNRLVRTLKGHKDCIYSVAWSPDGEVIASGSYDKAVKLWDAQTGVELRELHDHIDAVFAVAFSPDGKHLASASQDRTVKIWDVATGKRLYTLSDAADGLTALAYSPDGLKLAAAGYDKTIYVWQLGPEEGHLLHSLIADEDSQLSLTWSRDGKTIVTGSADRSIRFRDVNLELKGVVDRQPDWVDALDMSPDGKWVAAGRYDGSLGLYDAATFKEARNIPNATTTRQAGISRTTEAASR